MEEITLLHLSDYVSSKEDFHYVFYDHFNPRKTIKHNHTYYEVMLITENAMHHHVNGKSTVLEAGNICFIRPEDTHHFTSYKRQICSFVNLSFRARLIESLFAFLEIQDYKKLLEDKYPPVISVSPHRLSELTSKLSNLKGSDFDNFDSLNLTAKVLLVNIFSLFYTSKIEEIKSLPRWLKKTMYLMQEPKNFRGGVKRMIEIACVSPEHLSRTFKKHNQQTPSQFITKIRIKYAVRMLMRTDTPIMEISNECGFSSASHFYTAFKEIHQCTPLQYRKNRLVRHVIPQ